MIGTPRAARRDGLHLPRRAHPELIDAVEGKVVDDRVPPPHPGLPPSVAQPGLQQPEDGIPRGRVEVAAQDHRYPGRDRRHALGDRRELRPTEAPVHRLLPPALRRIQVHPHRRGHQPEADHLSLSTARERHPGRHEVGSNRLPAGIPQPPANQNRRVRAAEHAPLAPVEPPRQRLDLPLAGGFLKQHHVRMHRRDLARRARVASRAVERDHADRARDRPLSPGVPTVKPGQRARLLRVDAEEDQPHERRRPGPDALPPRKRREQEPRARPHPRRQHRHRRPRIRPPRVDNPQQEAKKEGRPGKPSLYHTRLTPRPSAFVPGPRAGEIDAKRELAGGTFSPRRSRRKTIEPQRHKGLEEKHEEGRHFVSLLVIFVSLWFNRL
jgi:hypothetical protein